METAPQLGGFFHAQVGVADCEVAVIVDSTRAAGSGEHHLDRRTLKLIQIMPAIKSAQPSTALAKST
jgi:hypothetical protein